MILGWILFILRMVVRWMWDVFKMFFGWCWDACGMFLRCFRDFLGVLPCIFTLLWMNLLWDDAECLTFNINLMFDNEFSRWIQKSQPQALKPTILINKNLISYKVDSLVNFPVLCIYYKIIAQSDKIEGFVFGGQNGDFSRSRMKI